MIVTVTANPCVDRFYFIDGLISGRVNRIAECRVSAGGKGINVAKAASLLGEETAATGFLGGCSGEFIRGSLLKNGIRDAFVAVGEETRTCISIKELQSGRQTELLEPGCPVPCEKQLELLTAFGELLKGCSVAVISGSVPPSTGEDLYPRLIRLARDAGRTVILDTSGRLLQTGVDACPHIVKPNREELAAFAGREIGTRDEIIDAALSMKDKGIDTVIVSLGREGAVFVTEDGVYQGTTPDIRIVNSLGCGDSLVAGFAVGLSRGLPITQTIRLSMAVSTANALCKEAGSFLQTDLERLLGEVGAVRLR